MIPDAKRRRTAVALFAALLLVGASVAGTLLIEQHTQHGDGEHEGEGQDHGKEAKGAHGREEEGEGHGREARGDKGHEKGKAETVKLSEEMLANADIELVTAGPGKVAVTLELPGEVALNAERMAHVTPRIGGTVRDVKRQLGDQVRKGDVLALLDSKELAEMQRDVLATKERLALAENSFRRAESLWAEKISAEKDFLAAKNQLAEAQIEHRSAAQKLAAAAGSGARGAGLALLAPLDGTIIEKHISIGEVLADDTQAFIIADLSLLWVQVTVYAKDLSRVEVGQLTRVRAEGIAEPAVGKITYLGSVVGEETRTAAARVELDNPGAAWRPGLFVTAEVAIDEAAAAVSILDAAVQRVEGREVVFVRSKEGFEARPVKIGRRGIAADAGRGAVVEILEGVAPGEAYAARNSFVLKAELGKSEAGHDHAH
ncbi:MAG: efflux RND transporter periplasmic adaptor subunit [Polyangiaceae bacterium]